MKMKSNPEKNPWDDCIITYMNGCFVMVKYMVNVGEKIYQSHGWVMGNVIGIPYIYIYTYYMNQSLDIPQGVEMRVCPEIPKEKKLVKGDSSPIDLEI